VHKVGVHGAKDFNVREAWQVESKAVGMEIKVVAISLEYFAKALEEHHVPKFFANVFVEFTGAFISELVAAEPTTPETTTSTTLFEWAQTAFKPALEATNASQ
jgi:hypothetical protein